MSLPAAPLHSTVPAFDAILYGAAYYHEYMPYERLAEDVRLMREAGVNVVRVGESTWSLWEPREGEFEFAWIDRVLDAMHAAEIRVILGTPTYSIPPWMAVKHPEILVQNVAGEKLTYGMRQNMNIGHPTYRFYCERVIRQILGHCAPHPAIIGYQVDNETTSYGAANPDLHVAFLDWLRRRYGTVENLNRRWGLQYWGQNVNDWSELPPRKHVNSTGYKLEWDRFGLALAADFVTWQARIVREYARPGQWVMHDFMPFLSPQDYVAGAREHDLVAMNIYHPVQDRLDGHAIASGGDLARAIKRGNYLVTETNAQGIGWDASTQFPPYPGQLRQCVYSHLASGANLVAYWHWHSLHHGQETYWRGVLGHDLRPNRVYAEMSRTAHELQRLSPALVNLRKVNRIALLSSLDSRLALGHMRFTKEGDAYVELQTQAHRCLYEQNFEADYVLAENADFSGYDLLLVPPLYVADDALLDRIVDFVAHGGHAVVWFKSGFCNEHATVRHDTQPGRLHAAAGVAYQDFTSLAQPLPLAGESSSLPHGGATVKEWLDLVLPAPGTEVLARVDHPTFREFAAITRRLHGKGTFTYIAGWVSDTVLKSLLRETAEKAGLVGPEQQLVAPVIVRKGVNGAGRTVRYLFNYGAEPRAVAYPFGEGKRLLGGESIRPDEPLELPAWGVEVVEEA